MTTLKTLPAHMPDAILQTEVDKLLGATTYQRDHFASGLALRYVSLLLKQEAVVDVIPELEMPHEPGTKVELVGCVGNRKIAVEETTLYPMAEFREKSQSYNESTRKQLLEKNPAMLQELRPDEILRLCILISRVPKNRKDQLEFENGLCALLCKDDSERHQDLDLNKLRNSTTSIAVTVGGVQVTMRVVYSPFHSMSLSHGVFPAQFDYWVIDPNLAGKRLAEWERVVSTKARKLNEVSNRLKAESVLVLTSGHGNLVDYWDVKTFLDNHKWTEEGPEPTSILFIDRSREKEGDLVERWHIGILRWNGAPIDEMKAGMETAVSVDTSQFSKR